MRINRLKIRNFKGFSDRTIDLPRRVDGGTGSVHVLIGQNGRGKTTALDALAVAAGSWFLGVPGAESRHIKPADVRIKVNDFRNTQRVERQLPVVVEAEGEVLGEPMQWSRALEGKKTRWVHARSIKDLAEETIARVRDGDGVALPLISYYGTGRLWLEPRDTQGDAQGAESDGTSMPSGESDESLANAFASRLAGYRYSIDPRCSPRDLLRWLAFEHRIARDEGRESPQLHAVKEAILRSVEGCSGVRYHARLGLLLEIQGQGWLPFGALSDGQRNMVAMIGDLAYKAAQLNPQLDDVLGGTEGVVLIDEVDLHLHPRWQRHILEDLRGTFPAIQFVVTTHSPFIVQSAREGELITLDVDPVPETASKGLEEIAAGLMQVEHPGVSARYAEMVGVAKDYLQTVDEAVGTPPERLARYLDELAQKTAPYAENPAFQAFLELKREAKLGGAQGKG